MPGRAPRPAGAVPESPTARLFVALELRDDAVATLVAWRREALAATAGLRPVARANLHLTLCFLGARPLAEAGAIGAEVATVARAARLPGLALGPPLLLPPRRARVLAVAIEDPSGALHALRSELADRLARRRFYAPEARPFLAHVTLARSRIRERVRAGELPPVPAGPLAAAAVTLFRSRLGAGPGGGSAYEPLVVVPVGPPGDLRNSS